MTSNMCTFFGFLATLCKFLPKKNVYFMRSLLLSSCIAIINTQYLNLLNTSESYAFWPGSFCFDFWPRSSKQHQKMPFLYIFWPEKAKYLENRSKSSGNCWNCWIRYSSSVCLPVMDFRYSDHHFNHSKTLSNLTT